MLRRGIPLQGLEQGFQGYGDLAGRARDYHTAYDQAHLEGAIEQGPQAFANESFNQARGKWNYGSPMDQFMQAAQEAGGGRGLKFGYAQQPQADLSRDPNALDQLQRAMPRPMTTFSKSTQLGTPIDSFRPRHR